MKYNFSKIEAKWQKEWAKRELYRAEDVSLKPKYYSLIEFPYPSGDGLHVGHIRSTTAMDIISRKRRMEGYNVLFPIGWDAFGLPTENYAIKTGEQPEAVTKKNTDVFRKQLQSLGFSFDWKREINTTDQSYYKWTQWMFLKFFEKGLAYKARIPINWCPKDKIGLANEEVVGGKCERCGTPVLLREREQWMLKITAYADKLLEGLKHVDFLPEIKRQQEHWILRSEGATIGFRIESSGFTVKTVEIFTTRLDTIFGVTFVAISAEMAKKWLEVGWKPQDEIKKYIEQVLADRKNVGFEATEKSGIFSGVQAVNPINGETVPVWITNYVLGGVGTGAVMGVPAHDERDFEFAKKYNLPVRFVIGPSAEIVADDKVHIERGFLHQSGTYNGMTSDEATEALIKELSAKREVRYRLRDWVFSRQRYWGEPIPLIFCESCKEQGLSRESLSVGERLNPGWIPVSEKDLPVTLPEVKDYKPRDDGESPLASIESWVKVRCPRCGGLARRETDTMPNWAGSSWYFIGYLIAENLKSEELISKQIKGEEIQAKLKHWLPVDWYNGGMEHVTLHLLYSRFWNQFLHDEGLVPVSEPYRKRTAHGLILAAGGVKMSKSKGNVVRPDDLIAEFGADALRVYEMFMGPFNQVIAWDEHGILGTYRFLERVFRLATQEKNPTSLSSELARLLELTVKKVGEDIESMSFNTAVSAMMILVNEIQAAHGMPRDSWKTFLLILAPFAPHLSEELWEKFSGEGSVHLHPWPAFDERVLVSALVKIVVQINGKIKTRLSVPAGLVESEVTQLALADPAIAAQIKDATVRRIVFVPDRLINIVV